MTQQQTEKGESARAKRRSPAPAETAATATAETGAGEKRRQARQLQELAAEVLAMKLEGYDEVCAALRSGGLDDGELSYAAGIVLVQARRAMGGDLKAAEFIRELSGQKSGGPVGEPGPGVDLRGLSDAQLLAMIDGQ